MTKEEIQDWLKRVDKLGNMLDGEDKETLDWLVYGYNYCAKKCLELENIKKNIRNFIDNALPCIHDEEILNDLLNILQGSDE